MKKVCNFATAYDIEVLGRSTGVTQFVVAVCFYM